MPSRRKRGACALPVLVYGVFPEYGTLIFETLPAASAGLRTALARGTAETWGDYMLLDPDGAECDSEAFLHDAPFQCFLDYCVAYKDKFGVLDMADARKRYSALHPGLRPPIPSDPLNLCDFVEQLLESGSLPMPTVSMSCTLPQEIIDRFAEVGSGVWDGPHVTIAPDLENEVVAALRELGYKVIRDDKLVDYSIGYERVAADGVMELMIDPMYRAMALPETAVGYDEDGDEWGIFD